MKPQTARTLAVVVLLGAAAWLLRHAASAICWSVLIAVSTWPLHDRLQRAIGTGTPALSAALLTAAAVGLLLAPIVLLVVGARHELPVLLRVWSTSGESGLPAPVWIARLPWLGAWALRQWNENVADPGALREAARSLAGRFDFEAGRTLVAGFGHRVMAIFFIVLVLYFLYRDGERLAVQVRSITARWFGRPGLRTLRLATATVRGTVNGLVLVGLALAAVLSLAYASAGVPHAPLWGLATGLLGIVPFGAGIVLAAVCLYLFAVGATAAALVLLVGGAVLIFVVDHFVRPLFVSGASRVPLVLALLGIVGGLETFGILGLFVGPTLIAVAVAVWRELAAASRSRAAVPEADG